MRPAATVSKKKKSKTSFSFFFSPRSVSTVTNLRRVFDQVKNEFHFCSKQTLVKNDTFLIKY